MMGVGPTLCVSLPRGRSSQSRVRAPPTTSLLARCASRWSGASLLSASSATVYAGQSTDHRESGGTADAPDLGSGARKGVGVRLPPLARLKAVDPCSVLPSSFRTKLA